MDYAQGVTRRRTASPLTRLAVLFVAACAPGPIEWADPVALAPELQTALALDFDAQGRLMARAQLEPDGPPFAGQCAGSTRVARTASGARYAVWWSMRPPPDSAADVMASWSADGAAWSIPARVDTADVGRIGCRRLPPAIAADGDNVHVVYPMAAREGPGIFSAHSMDRGVTFHSPVAVVYGEKLGLASIAARGNLVVVAYEDPNTSPTRISVALSRTMAHLFEYRQIVSPSGGAVAAPGIATDGKQIAVTWVRPPSGPSSPRSVRLGLVRYLGDAKMIDLGERR